MRNHNHYTNMTFSDEEIQKLIQIKKIIVSWIEENAKLTGHQEIKIDFGPDYYSVDGDMAKSYHITILGSSMFRGGIESKIWFGERFARCQQPLINLYSPYMIYPIVDNWDYIKGEIYRYKNAMDEVKSKINNFNL